MVEPEPPADATFPSLYRKEIEMVDEGEIRYGPALDSKPNRNALHLDHLVWGIATPYSLCHSFSNPCSIGSIFI